MIHTVADLLEALITKERENLPAYADIEHTGIFGAMYEGLTQDVLSRGLFAGADLRVVRGKVQNSKGTLSRQIDCMVVIGDGKPIPYTEEVFYPVDQVVMIVEVKKTLYGDALKEALELFQHFWAEVAEEGNLRTGTINDAWRSMFFQNLPKPDVVEKLPFHQQQIYHSLVTEATLPVRVIFGYDGYVDEHGLRKGLIKYLEEINELPIEKRPRFNINTFPNLIVCKQASLIKLDGMPYPGVIMEDGSWIFMASRGEAPFYSLLELLWTRLAYLLELSPEIFGEDLSMESVKPLLTAKAIQLSEKQGWKYIFFELTQEQLSTGETSKDWHPATLTKPEFAVIHQLCNGKSVDISDPSLAAFCAEHAQTVDQVCQNLNRANLAAIKGSSLELITDECQCVFLPDGRCVAADNKSGRLTHYVMKVMAEWKNKKADKADQ